MISRPGFQGKATFEGRWSLSRPETTRTSPAMQQPPRCAVRIQPASRSLRRLRAELVPRHYVASLPVFWRVRDEPRLDAASPNSRISVMRGATPRMLFRTFTLLSRCSEDGEQPSGTWSPISSQFATRLTYDRSPGWKTFNACAD
jgi:hypothetical protein